MSDPASLWHFCIYYLANQFEFASLADSSHSSELRAQNWPKGYHARLVLSKSRMALYSKASSGPGTNDIIGHLVAAPKFGLPPPSTHTRALNDTSFVHALLSPSNIIDKVQEKAIL